MFAPARLTYSGSAAWSSRFEVAMALSVWSRSFALSRLTWVSAATRATSRIHWLFRVRSATSFGLQEWSPAIAGMAAKSMHAGFGPWMPSESSGQSVPENPFCASVQSAWSASRSWGESFCTPATAMSRCSG